MGFPVGIICHCGAGFHSKVNEEKYNALTNLVCDSALASHVQTLEESLSIAMSILERSSLTNCGAVGGNLDRNGNITADVGIMKGDYSYGAIGALPCRVDSGNSNLFNIIYEPHLLALDLLHFESTRNDRLGRIPPLCLVGNSAYQLAIEGGIVQNGLDPITLTTRHKWEKHCSWMDQIMDTVGVIVFDNQGHVLSSVSSCGMSLKEPGRVGEAAVFGAGLWAQDMSEDCPALGLSASGQGEQLIRTALGRSAGNRLGTLGQDLQEQIMNLVRSDFLDSPLLNSYDPQERDMGFILYHLEEVNDKTFGEFWYAVCNLNFTV